MYLYFHFEKKDLQIQKKTTDTKHAAYSSR